MDRPITTLFMLMSVDGKISTGADKMISDYKARWRCVSENLISSIVSLGFPEELGIAVVRNLGSPKAMERMTSYLHNVKPKKAELIVDEMLSIRSEFDAWREKKANCEANQRYNELLYFGLEETDDDNGSEWE